MSEISYIDIHTHRKNCSENSIAVYNHPIEIKAVDEMNISVGIHPWNLEKVNIKDALDKILVFCEHQSVKAIGEIGFDKMIAYDFNLQKEVFFQQIEIAEQFNLPVIIHCVKYFSELIQIRKRKQFKTPWIIHGFRKNLQLANDLINSGCFLSFGEALLHHVKVQECFYKLPVERLFLETDESTVSIEDLYHGAAKCKEMDPIHFIKKIEQNYKNYIIR